MSVSELSVRKPVTVTMAYVLVIVVSAIFVPRLGVALFPSTSMPVLSVSTSWPNAGPEEVEKNVTDLLESRLSAVAGLDSVNSTSSAGQSSIRLSFGYDVDLDGAEKDVQDILNRSLGSLPDDAGTPTLRRFDMSSMPIMRLTVKGDLPVSELRSLAEDTISPLLERIEGVASADVNGGAQRVVRVDVSENRLRAYGLTLSGVAQSLAARNVKTSGGTLTDNGVNWKVAVDESFRSLDDIRQTVVSTVSVPAPGSSVNRSNVVRLADIAEVYETYDYSGSRVYIDGNPGLYMSVSNETDANSASVAKSVHVAIPEINRELPNGVTVSVISDNTTMITSTMDEVYNSAIQGGLLAMLIILLFLRSVKGTLIIGLSMPISILVTLLVMSLMGLTLNMMTMTGLILGIGMIVDSSIVVLDNIHRYRERGENAAVAAIHGSSEMITAITASTLTTLCVFLPVIIYKAKLEMLGQIFNDMVVTVVASLTVSLVVAVTLVPALAGSVLRLNTRHQRPIRNPLVSALDNGIETAFAALEEAYALAIRWVLKNRLLVMTLVATLLALSVMKFVSLGMSFAPTSSSDDVVNISLTLPQGTDGDVTADTLFRAQDLIKASISGYENMILTVGNGNSGSIQINLPELSRQTMGPDEIKAKVRPLLDSFPGATFSFSAGRGFRGGAAVNVRLTSNDTEAVSATAERIVEILKEQVPECTDISSDLTSGNPQYTVSVDRDRASALGVSVSAVAAEIRAALNGVSATTWQTGNEEVAVKVFLRESDMAFLSDLGRLYVTGSRGRVSLDNLVSFEKTLSPRSISHEEGVRVTNVSASLAPGAVSSKVQPKVEAALAEYLVLPDSVKLSYNGEFQDLSKSGSAMAIVILLAVFLVFIVMAAQFESLVDPFIIFFSIPLLAIGVVWTYAATGQSFSLFSAVGVVALVGIVVNNGIVLVDYANGLLRKKVPVIEACVTAGRNRLRPILMTSLTTIIATVPMGFFPGKGGEMMQPIGVTIVGGMASGALMTLFVTPIMYSLLNKRRERRFEDPESLQNMLAELK